MNVFDGLVYIAEQFKGEWYITDCTLNLVNKLTIGSEVLFEVEKTIAPFTITEGDKQPPFNRIVALGSTKNLPSNYREADYGEAVDAVSQKRLRIPASKGNEIDAVENMTPEEVIEGSVIFDDVFPQRTGTISDVQKILRSEVDKETGEKHEFYVYRYKDAGLNFKSSYILPDQELNIYFSKSVRLNGLDFAVKFNPDNQKETSPEAQVFEIILNDKFGKTLPNESLYPENGDEIVLTGFNIQLVADQYVPEAEEELYETAVEWLKDIRKDKRLYNCPAYSDVFEQNKLDLEIGQRVKLISDNLEEGSRSSRVMGYQKKLLNPYDCIYTIGDNPKYSRIGNIEKDIEEIKYAGMTFQKVSSGSGNIYLIKQYDITTPTEHNAYSAKASDRRFLNRLSGGVVEGDTIFNRNVQVQRKLITDYVQNSTFTAGQFGSGFQLKNEENGLSFFEVDFLNVRREMNVSVLTIADIESVNGGRLASLANLTCSKVEELETGYKCFFDNDEETIPNRFAVNDQAICRRYNGKTAKYYWRLVTEVDKDYIILSKTDCDGTGVPEERDDIIQFGNRTNSLRQAAIFETTYGNDAPARYFFSGINSYDLTGKAKTYTNNSGSRFEGEFVISSHGTTAPVYKDREFKQGFTYYLNDRVSYNGAYWLCIANNTVLTPSENSSVWKKETTSNEDIDNVMSEAQRAQQEADDAKAKADNAQAAADLAKTNAQNAQNTANKAQTNAQNAQNAANKAQSDVNSVSKQITDFSDDNKLTPNEKQSVVSDWNNIKAEYPKMVEKAKEYGLTYTAYQTAYNTLNTYITPILSDLTTTSSIDGATFRLNFEKYHTAYIDLINAISKKSKELADTAQSSANTAKTTANNAQTSANNAKSAADKAQASADNAKTLADKAQTAANNAKAAADKAQTAANNAQSTANTAKTDAAKANTLLTDIASDNKLTANEKQDTKKEWDAIVSEYSKNTAQAGKFGVSKTTYTNAYNALNTYITPLLSSLTTTSSITGTDFRAKFKTYYDARTDLLNSISTKAKEAADKAQKEAEKVRSEYQSDFKVLNDRIELKVAKTDFNTLGNRVSKTESSVTQQAGQIQSAITSIDNTTLLAKAMAYGKMLYKDPTFKNGLNGAMIYNNSGNGMVTVTRIAKISGTPTTSTHCLEIRTKGTGTTPNFGGFCFQTKTRANAKFATRIIAKIPKGIKINLGTNDIGTGGKKQWLTSIEGTGNWEEYILLIICGSSGTFSTTNFFSVFGTFSPSASNPLIWYLAYATVFDITDTEIDYDAAIKATESKITQTDSRITTEVKSMTTKIDKFKTDLTSQINQTASSIELKITQGDDSTYNKVKSSIKLNKNEITVAGTTIKLSGSTIADAIKIGGDLVVGDRSNAAKSALEVKTDGLFYARGVKGSAKLEIDSSKQEINLESNNTYYIDDEQGGGQSSSSAYTTKINISAPQGSISVRNNNDVASISSEGIFANKAGTTVYPASSGISSSAAVVGLGFGNRISYLTNTDDFIAGVFGRADNSATGKYAVPAFGGYFNALHGNGFSLGMKVIIGDTTKYTYLSALDSLVISNSSKNQYVYLPSGVPKGTIVFLKQWHNGTMFVRPPAGGKLYDDYSYENEQKVPSGGWMAMCVYIGDYTANGNAGTYYPTWLFNKFKW